MIDEVDSPVDHIKFDPVAVNVELPQLSVTVTAGAAGIGVGFATIDPFGLTQPETVWVTVYVPLVNTVIDEVDSPVDHIKFDPVAVKIELPQLSVTVTVGAEGAEGADRDTIKLFEGHVVLKLTV